MNDEEKSSSIPEFCVLENISPASYHKMKRAGLGPKEYCIPGTCIIRITPDARREWHERMAKLSEDAAAKLEQTRRADHARRAGQAAVRSPKHICRQRQLTPR